MGSYQQIILGVICLGAAFAFGSFINSNPEASARLGDEISEGRVESRISADDLGLMVQQSTEMPQLQPRQDSPLELPPSVSGSDPLPPPSQLAQTQPGGDASGDSSFAPAPLNQKPMSSMPAMTSAQSIDLKELANSFEAPGTGRAEVADDIPDFFDDKGRDPLPLSRPSVSAPTFAKPAITSVQSEELKDVEPPSATSILKPLPSAESPVVSTIAGAPTLGKLAEIPPGEAPLPAPPGAVTSRMRQPIDSMFETAVAPRKSVAIDSVVVDPGPAEGVGLGGNESADITPAVPTSTGRPRIPFGLNAEAKTKLVRLKNVASSRIGLESTEFAEHTVQQGETLQQISSRYLGKPDHYLDIYLANRDRMQNPSDLRANMVLKIPIYQDR